MKHTPTYNYDRAISGALLSATTDERQMWVAEAQGQAVVDINRWGPLPFAEFISRESRSSARSLRFRRMLQYCLAPVLDKAQGNIEPDDFPTSDYTFVLPFEVTLLPEAVAAGITLGPQTVDGEALGLELSASGLLNPLGSPFVCNALLSRGDFQAMGPEGVCSAMSAAANGAAFPCPSSRTLDPDQDSYRTVVLGIPCTVRLPRTETQVLARPGAASTARMAEIVAESLKAQGVAVESVTPQQFASLQTMLRLTTGPAGAEIVANLANGKAQWERHSIGVQLYPLGYAELMAKLPQGVATVMPAFSFMESEDELSAFVQATCESLGLEFMGVRPTQFATAEGLH